MCEALRANVGEVVKATIAISACLLGPHFIRRFSARPSGAIKSITSSVMEKRISSACLHEKFVRHGQRATLVGLQRNFLRQHDVACDEMTFRRKTPTNTRTAGAVDLVDVHRGATLVRTLRKIYGQGFAAGYPETAKLSEVLLQLNETSLSQLRRDHETDHLEQ